MKDPNQFNAVIDGAEEEDEAVYVPCAQMLGQLRARATDVGTRREECELFVEEANDHFGILRAGRRYVAVDCRIVVPALPGPEDPRHG